jgi:nicotinate-nucleotide adenylyltransferase
MAEAARDVLELDRVMLMPAPRPPHKDPEGLSPWEHRVAMARLAAGELDGVEVSLHEADTPGDSYTAESLRRYRRLNDDEIYFILGADSLRDLPGWKEPEAILSLATLVVFPRAGFEARLFGKDEAGVVVFESPAIDVSSSEVRRKRRAGEPIDALVPPPVLDYIMNHDLYTR